MPLAPWSMLTAKTGSSSLKTLSVEVLAEVERLTAEQDKKVGA